MTEEGFVRFSVPALPVEAGPVVELRDHNLNLVGQAQPGLDFSLDPGLYVASVVLPTGESEQHALQVLPGETVEVELGPDEAAQAAETLEVHDVALEADLPSDLVLKTGGPNASTPPQEWFARIVRASDGAPVDAGAALETLERTSDRSGAVTDLLCTTPPDAQGGLLWLQVAVPGQAPSNCMLPILCGTAAEKCRVRVVAATDAIRATALPAGSKLIDSVAAYLTTGHLRAAAHVAANAQDLLFSQLENPVKAALGACALARLDRLDEVAYWITDLAARTPVLPDGAVFAAELAARNGKPKDAQRWLDEAVKRGTPMFTDALSLLVARTRPTDPDEEVDDGLKRLLAIATLADFAQLVVAFPAADPLQPLAESTFDDFDPKAGWQGY
jgi:hypothetical protein